MVEDNWLKIWYDLVFSGSIFILLDRRASEVRLGKKSCFPNTILILSFGFGSWDSSFETLLMKRFE